MANGKPQNQVDHFINYGNKQIKIQKLVILDELIWNLLSFVGV